MMNFTNDEMNLMCIYSAGSSRTGLIQKLTEMKKYLERDEVQLLSLTESTLAKLGAMTDEEFGQLELYPDFGIRLDSYFRFLRETAKIFRRPVVK